MTRLLATERKLFRPSRPSCISRLSSSNKSRLRELIGGVIGDRGGATAGLRNVKLRQEVKFSPQEGLHVTKACLDLTLGAPRLLANHIISTQTSAQTTIRRFVSPFVFSNPLLKDWCSSLVVSSLFLRFARTSEEDCVLCLASTLWPLSTLSCFRSGWLCMALDYWQHLPVRAEASTVRFASVPPPV